MGELKEITTLYKSSFSKRDKSLWIFGAWAGEKFSDNPKFLYLLALKEGINAVWITKNKKVYEELEKRNLPVEMYGSKKGTELQKRAGIACYCVGTYDFNDKYLGGATLINLWHGVPLKKIYYDDHVTCREPKIRRMFVRLMKRFPYRKTYIISTSPAITEIYSSAFRINRKHILELGQPRNDIFFDNTYEDEFDFSFAKKLITYMPTHRNEGKKVLDIEKILDLEKINNLCGSTGYKFAIKKHFYHRNEKLQLDNYDNIVDLTSKNVDTQELLKHTDILVTDYSSVYIDYLLLDRPIIFYNFDMESYLINDREMYFNYNEVTPGIKASDNEGLIKALEKICIEKSDVYCDKRGQCLNLFYGKNIKKSGKKIIKSIKKLC